jgi:hypothetical protein
MSYLGNQPTQSSLFITIDKFNGNNSCTQFTLTQSGLSDLNALDIRVNNIPQEPTAAYSLANSVITFTEAPSTGTNNIIAIYRVDTVITYGAISGNQINDGSVTSAKLASGIIVPSATANSAALYANAAFVTANTVTVAGSYANAAFLQANTPSYTANSAASYANSAFATANTVTAAGSYANSAFSTANVAISAASYANSAFGKANNALTPSSNTTTNVQFGSLGVGTAASGTTGEIRTTNNITAYYSSDIRYKNNIINISEPLEKLDQINGVEFDWTDKYIEEHGGEDGYFVRKHDIGVIAQELEKVLPELVVTREDGYKAVKYDRIVCLLIEAVKDINKQLSDLKNLNKK